MVYENRQEKSKHEIKKSFDLVLSFLVNDFCIKNKREECINCSQGHEIKSE